MYRPTGHNLIYYLFRPYEQVELVDRQAVQLFLRKLVLYSFGNRRLKILIKTT